MLAEYFAVLLPLMAVDINSADLDRAAASFACNAEKKAELSRLAVFTFTDRDGGETDESQDKTTVIMSRLTDLCGGVQLIDKSHQAEVLDEIALSQTGIVDEKTMLTPDQLIGADSMLFGIFEDTTLELRVLEAKTGKLLAAQVFQQNDPSQDVQTADSDGDDSYYMKRWLIGSAATQPEMYLYVTSTPTQWNILSARYPYLQTYTQNLPPNRLQQFSAWRNRVGSLQAQNRLPAPRMQSYRHLAVQRSRAQHAQYFNSNAYHGHPQFREYRMNPGRTAMPRYGERRQPNAQRRGEGRPAHHAGEHHPSGGHHSGGGAHGGGGGGGHHGGGRRR